MFHGSGNDMKMFKGITEDRNYSLDQLTDPDINYIRDCVYGGGAQHRHWIIFNLIDYNSLQAMQSILFTIVEAGFNKSFRCFNRHQATNGYPHCQEKR